MPIPALALALFVAPNSSGHGPDDWPCWGGPTRNGVSLESKWSVKGAEKPLWRREVGLGYSAVAVQEKRLYTLGYDKETEHDVLWCLDALTGEELWVHAWPAKLMDLYHGGGTLTTPTAAGEHVFVSEREGWLQCLKSADGSLLWQKNLTKELALTIPQWGFSASPLLLGDELVLNYGTVCAFDAKTGALRWKTEKSYGDAYSTPIECTLAGQPALAVFSGAGLVLLAPKGGKELGLLPWKTQYDVNAMTPVVLGQRLFISSGYDKGSALLDLAGDAPEVLWENKVMKNQMGGALPWKEHLYGFDDKVLKCMDLGGKELWRERGFGQGALSIADGKLLIASEEGELIVAEAAPGGFKELARRSVVEGGICWTMPVLANGIIYFRNHAGELVALDHRAR
ncbi:MAG: PQQ-binding-like beta-propeller repeat protein [Planctomycetota bacterium]